MNANTADINAYYDHNHYLSLQLARPDYAKAIPTIITLAEKYTKNTPLAVADFCCGVGNITKAFSEKRPIQEALLIDINKEFLNATRKLLQNIPSVTIINEDILKADIKHTYDIVFSVFSYHHIRDKEKEAYVKQVRKALKKTAHVILAEIYFNTKEHEERYYRELYEMTENQEKNDVLKAFLMQTAKSKNFEFKVSKEYAKDSFAKKGLKIIEEKKIWPDDLSDEGMFVQVLTL